MSKINTEFDTNFGTDPEIFVVDRNNSCIPPAALIADYGFNYSTRHDGKKVLYSDLSIEIIEDGAATEINIEPSNNLNEFNSRIQRSCEQWANKILLQTEKLFFKILTTPSVDFDTKKYWEDRDETFRECVMFGCDPDLDIYSGEFCKEIAADNVPKRFGGGHIHMQAPDYERTLFVDNYYHTARLMDCLVGNTATALKRTPEIIACEKDRLKFYGRPGKIRLQEYSNGQRGIEYRTPSNFWIDSYDYTGILLNMMNIIFNMIRHPEDVSEILSMNLADIVPNNIIEFNQKRASEHTLSFIDKLLSMKYIDYDLSTLVVDSCYLQNA